METRVGKKGLSHKKNLISLINKAAYMQSTWTIFSDFLEMSAVAISNAAVTKDEVREKRYFEAIEKYRKQELDLFPEMLGELVEALEEDPTDILGEVFQEMELSSKWHGQFFTPMSICRAMGEMMIPGLKQTIEEKGFATVSEPVCGGGAMIIGLAQAMKAAGLNPQEQIIVTAVDVDLKAVHMTYLQLSLLGIPAVVVHGNTLLVQEWSRWYTPMYVWGVWSLRKRLRRLGETVKPEIIQTEEIKASDVICEQLNLFDMVEGL
jgi:type I restriction-modification system DNA methylase subunit